MKDNKGYIHMAYLILILGCVLGLLYMILSMRIIQNHFDREDNFLTASAFSGTICDFKRMSESIDISKTENEDNVYYDFEKMYSDMCVLIDTKRAVDELWKICGTAVEKICIYNVSGGDIEVTEYSYEGGISVEHYPKEGIVTPNGVMVNDSILYLKVKSGFSDAFRRKWKVSLEKCVKIKMNCII